MFVCHSGLIILSLIFIFIKYYYYVCMKHRNMDKAIHRTIMEKSVLGAP